MEAVLEVVSSGKSPKRDLNSPSHIWQSSQIKRASENVPSVLWQSSHSTEWILSRRHLSVAALPPTSSYLGRPDCPDCDRCRSRVEIWSNCKTTLSLFIQGDIFTAPRPPFSRLSTSPGEYCQCKLGLKWQPKCVTISSPVPHMFQILLGSNHWQF